MSVLGKLLSKSRKKSHRFIVVQGIRGAGKTCTAAGTLPGKTLLLQSVQEAGSESAVKLNDNLVVASFETIEEFQEVCDELLATGHDYDNIVLDSISELCDMYYDLPKVQALIKKDIWGGFRLLGDNLKNVISSLKLLSASCNVVMTLAVDTTLDANGNITKVKPCVKGNVAIGQIIKKSDVIVTIVAAEEEVDGKTVMARRLILKPWSGYQNRVDGILDKENPGVINADMKELFALIEGGK